MGRDSEIFKAAQSGNNEYLERVFSIYLTTTGDRDGSSPRARGKRGGSGVRSVEPLQGSSQSSTLWNPSSGDFMGGHEAHVLGYIYNVIH